MMTLIFQFGRILLICFLAEALSALLPLPIPSSVYGLLLMLAALGLKLLTPTRSTATWLFMAVSIPPSAA